MGFFSTYKFQRSDILVFGLIVFFLGFMCIDDAKLHNNIYYVLVLGPLLFCAKARHFSELHQSPLANIFFIFLVYSVCTTFWSDFYSTELLVKYSKRAGYIYGLCLVAHIIVSDKPEFSRLLIKYLALAFSVFGCICLYIFYSGTYTEGSLGGIDTTRLWGVNLLEHPTFFSTVLTAYIAARLLDKRDFSQKSDWLLLSFMVILAVSVVVLSDSRSACMALIALIAAYALIEKKFLWIISVIVIAITGLSLLWYTESTIFFGRPGLQRLDIWMIFYERWSECNFFFGCGMNGWKTQIINIGGEVYMHAHSSYIGQLHTGGTVQLVSYMALLSSFAYQGVLIRATRPWILVLVAGATVSLFEFSKILVTPSPLWLLILMPMAMIITLSINEHRKN
jgi:hypothetical protein